MKAEIILVDNDSGFAERLKKKFADYVPEFVLTHVVPTAEGTTDIVQEVARAVRPLLDEVGPSSAVLVDIALDETGSQLDASGIAVARLIKSIRGDIPVYLVTSKVRTDEELAVLSLATREGLAGVFVKSFILGKLAHPGFLKDLVKPEAGHALHVSKSVTPIGDAEFEWVRALAELSIQDYCAVGDFVVAGQRARDRTRTIVSELRKTIDAAQTPFPVLVCGQPGAGKSFFVSQVARELGVGETSVLRRSLASAKNLEEDIRRLVREASDSKSRIVFVDEVDTKIQGETAYRFLLDVTKGEPVKAGRQTINLPGAIWFMAGSLATSAAAFKAAIAGEMKGPDFYRRFQEEGTIVEIAAPATFEDRVIQGAAGMKRVRPEIRGIASQVLYWFGSTPFADAGEVKAAARRVVLRFPKSDDQVDLRGIAPEDGFLRFVRDRFEQVDALDGRVVWLR
jgi:hypothetical protein